MTYRAVRLIAAAAAAVGLQAAGARVGAPSHGASSAAAPTSWVVSRTADGHADLQGIWDYRTLAPLERTS